MIIELQYGIINTSHCSIIIQAYLAWICGKKEKKHRTYSEVAVLNVPQFDSLLLMNEVERRGIGSV